MVVQSKGGVLTGRVVDTSGEPVADAWVTVERQAAWEPGAGNQERGAPVLTDETGSFKIENLEPVRYRVVARGPDGMATAEQENVSLGTDVTLKLVDPVSVIGHIRSHGGPVTDYVLFVSGSGRMLRFARADGSFEVNALRPGPHVLGVTSEQGFATRTIEIASGTATADFELQDWLSVNGRLVNADGSRPIAGAKLNLLFRGFSPAWMTRTDPQGAFHFPELPSGKAFLMVTSADGKMLDPQQRSFEIRAGTRELGDIRVGP